MNEPVPLGTLVIVERPSGLHAWCIVDDRGPAPAGRVIDVTPIVADQLDMISAGVVPVRVYELSR